MAMRLPTIVDYFYAVGEALAVTLVDTRPFL
jgi:hypothetical protein